jgi:hypothetical protein
MLKGTHFPILTAKDAKDAKDAMENRGRTNAEGETACKAVRSHAN